MFSPVYIEKYSRAPVKFPGWSQPGVPGLQARILRMKKATQGTNVIYMAAIVWMLGLNFEKST